MQSTQRQRSAARRRPGPRGRARALATRRSGESRSPPRSCLLNAIYDAPRDASGSAVHAKLDRRTPVHLGAEQQVELRYGCDGRNFVVSVVDRFGALERGHLERSLSKLLDPAGRTPSAGHQRRRARAHAHLRRGQSAHRPRRARALHRGHRGDARLRFQPHRAGARQRSPPVPRRSNLTDGQDRDRPRRRRRHCARRWSARSTRTSTASEILTAAQPGQRVTLRLDGVRSISSLGVRALEHFMQRLGAREVVLEDISAAIANQVTMIPNLLGTRHRHVGEAALRLPELRRRRAAQHSLSAERRHHARAGVYLMRRQDGVRRLFRRILAALNQRARFSNTSCSRIDADLASIDLGASPPRRAQLVEPPRGRTPSRRGLWPLVAES